MRALPGMAPDDIEIIAVRLVSPSFNSRFSAQWRRYSYRISRRRDIFRRNRQWFVPRGLDREAMDEAAAHFLGARDCASLCKTRSLRENNVCDVDLCRFDWDGDSGIFQVRSDRFLHHMVRTMVGTLVEVGRGTRSPDDVPDLLAACDRSRAGKMAPPQGLCLEEVGYPERLLDPDYDGPGVSPGPGPKEDA